MRKQKISKKKDDKTSIRWERWKKEKENKIRLKKEKKNKITEAFHQEMNSGPLVLHPTKQSVVYKPLQSVVYKLNRLELRRQAQPRCWKSESVSRAPCVRRSTQRRVAVTPPGQRNLYGWSIPDWNHSVYPQTLPIPASRKKKLLSCVQHNPACTYFMASPRAWWRLC